MSGFAGFFGYPLPLARLRQVHRLLSARGGDGAHAVAWNAAFERSKSDIYHALLADRFATRDPMPSAALPMRNALGNIWIVFDGYLAEAKELRQTLQAQGIRFQSQTDAEIALYAYEHWGIEAFARLNGAFACALLDLYTHKVYLVRDRFGQRPLAWWSQPQQLAFASSVRALAAGLPRWQVSASGVDAYLAHGYLPAPLTLLEGVQTLEHGSYCEFDLKQGNCRTNRFAEWQTNSAVDLAQRWQAAGSEYWRTDVAAALWLEPQMTSAVLAAQASSRWPNLPAVGLAHPKTAQLAQCLGLDWHGLTPTIRPSVDFTAWVQGLDLPVADPDWFWRWALAREAREYARVFIAAGEETAWLLENHPQLQRHWQNRWQRFLPTLLPVHAQVQTVAWQLPWQLSWLSRYTQHQGLAPNLRRYLLGGRVLRKLNYARAPLTLRHERLRHTALLQRSDWSHNLAEGYLHPLEGIYATQGMEVRWPYLDVNLCRGWLAQSPKRRQQWLQQHLPADIRQVSITPSNANTFTPPWAHWLRTEMADRLPVLGDQLQTLTRQQLRAPAIEALLVHSQHQPERYGHAVWHLCVLAEWLQQLHTLRLW